MKEAVPQNFLLFEICFNRFLNTVQSYRSYTQTKQSIGHSLIQDISEPWFSRKMASAMSV